MRLAAEERYQRDQVFAYIVDTLYSMLCVNHDKLQFTPTEMREAAMLACTKYEYTHVRTELLVKRGPKWSLYDRANVTMFGGVVDPPLTATGAELDPKVGHGG